MNFVRFACNLIWVILLLFTGLQLRAQLEWADYPYDLSPEYQEKVRFGYLSVPESRDDPQGTRLKIGFCVLKSSSEKQMKNAILYLPGGPGQGMTIAANFFLAGEHVHRMLKERDVVLFDPRGCGTSEPQFCGELEKGDIINSNLGGLTNLEYNNRLAVAMRYCRDSLEGSGYHLDKYGSYDIAMDAEDLRQALGYEQWNLRGHSYGSRYAQSIMRQYPESVRSAVISGIVPSAKAYEDRDFFGLVHALRIMLDHCAADPECHRSFPDLENDLHEALARLDKEPIVLKPGTSALLPHTPMVIKANVLLYGLFQAFYGREGYEMVPLLIHSIASGNSWLGEPLTLALGVDYQLEHDMYYLIRCNDNPGLAFAPEPLVEDPLVRSLYSYWVGNQVQTEAELCENLSLLPDTLEQQPVRSEVPVLIYSGEFDPVTPVYYADSVARYLTNAISLVIPGRGHDASVPMGDMMADFISNPENRLGFGQVPSEDPPVFLTRVSLHPGISGISVALAQNRYLWLVLPMAFSGLLILAGWVFSVVFGIRSLHRRTAEESLFLQWWPMGSLLFLCLLIMAMLALAFQEAMRIHPYLLIFGLPERWSWLFYVIWLVLTGFFLCSFFGVSPARKGKPATGRVFWILSWIGTLMFLVTLIYWHIY